MAAVVKGGFESLLSARGGWIEIQLLQRKPQALAVVALRKESVDRNYRAVDYQRGFPSRSPQGERG